ISAALRTSARVNCTLNVAAAVSTPCKYATCEGLPGSRRTATRVLPGAVSLSNSSHLPPIGYSKVLNPVMLPPGRVRLPTNTSLTGSETCTRKGVITTEQGVRPLAHESCEARFDLRTGPRFENLDLQSHAASSWFHVSQRGLCIRCIGRIDKHDPSGSGHKLTQ